MQQDRPPPTRPFAARLSQAAHALIHARAKEAGLSSRAWLEQAILANQTRIVARKTNHPDLGALLFQVNRAGNNLNQLARHFNTLALERPIGCEDVRQAIDLLVSIEQALTESLSRAR